MILNFVNMKKKNYREWGKKNKRKSYISQNCDNEETNEIFWNCKWHLRDGVVYLADDFLGKFKEKIEFFTQFRIFSLHEKINRFLCLSTWTLFNCRFFMEFYECVRQYRKIYMNETGMTDWACVHVFVAIISLLTAFMVRFFTI